MFFGDDRGFRHRHRILVLHKGGRYFCVQSIFPSAIYLPRLLAAPTDLVALNFFFDKLLFCGAILLLANSIDNEPAVARI